RYIERVYRARWQEGRDICDPATVADIATELGLPAERLAGAAEDRELREGPGLAALLALGRDGVFGVPFFLHGYDKFWGVDRLPAFVESVRARARPEPVEPGVGVSGGPDFSAARAGDQGHAGGCG
ncbi:DsbA family protein, partial [Streptomyces sp. MCAF7]